MAKQGSRLAQETQDLATGLAGLWDWLLALPFLFLLVAIPIRWGYGFFSEHRPESAAGAAVLLVLASSWAVRRRGSKAGASRKNMSA